MNFTNFARIWSHATVAGLSSSNFTVTSYGFASQPSLLVNYLTPAINVKLPQSIAHNHSSTDIFVTAGQASAVPPAADAGLALAINAPQTSIISNNIQLQVIPS